ncbi:MAG: aminotransferase class V-fold PLP-dependent enzyme [Candidatus Nitrosoabyssus spongiisocia]|nr:MAG: aminotransferase class V-fold PLP-dependent enzyme [Nitrosopumilaceae archaeon AB1(1)]
MQESIYLDYNSTTSINQCVFESMLQIFHHTFGNPSNTHTFRQQAKIVINKAREQVSDLIVPQH